VSDDHTKPIEDLHDCFVLFSPWARNSLDSKLWRSGDVDAVQQIPRFVDGDHSFIFGGLDLVSFTVHLLLLRITQRSVVLIIFIFSLIIFFFFVVLVVVVIVVVVIVAIVLWQLLSFISRIYHDHDLKGILLLRNILRRVGLQLQLRWHIPWHHLTNWLTPSALMSCAARMNHLKFGNSGE
jgi:hypothetical protein